MSEKMNFFMMSQNTDDRCQEIDIKIIKMGLKKLPNNLVFSIFRQCICWGKLIPSECLFFSFVFQLHCRNKTTFPNIFPEQDL